MLNIDIFYKLQSYMSLYIKDIKRDYKDIYCNRLLKDHGRQSCHGKAFELVIEKYLNICFPNSFSLDKNYTSKFDGQLFDIKVSIKNHHNLYSGLALSDISRNIHYANESNDEFFIIIRGSYNDTKDKSILSNITVLFIPLNYWRLCFKDFSNEYLQKWKDLFEEVGNSKEMDSYWKKQSKILKKENLLFDTIIQINPKRDHKSQRRLQCGINRKMYLLLLNNENIKYFIV